MTTAQGRVRGVRQIGVKIDVVRADCRNLENGLKVQDLGPQRQVVVNHSEWGRKDVVLLVDVAFVKVASEAVGDLVAQIFPGDWMNISA